MMKNCQTKKNRFAIKHMCPNAGRKMCRQYKVGIMGSNKVNQLQFLNIMERNCVVHKSQKNLENIFRFKF